jgi:hypothetical protein
MLFGPFLRREWVTSVRSLRMFRHRLKSVAAVAVAVAGLFLLWDWRGWDRASVSGASRFGLYLFGMVLAVQAGLAFQLLSTLGPSIAGERDRKSLDALLAARLSSAQIILGNLGAGVLRYLNSLVATLPVAVLVVTLGGIDPGLVFLTYSGIASVMFSLAAFSVAISAGSRTAARAGNVIVSVYLSWLMFPWLFLILKPLLWPSGPRWLVDGALYLLDGSPMGLLLNLGGLIPRPGGLPAAVSRLVGWQLAAGLALTAWAIARLRPASRAVYDLEGRISSLRALRAALRRPYPRPPCGDDPVLWNELYTLRGPSRMARLVGRLIGLASYVILAVGTSWFALPAFSELRERGYVASAEATSMPEFNPFIRVIVSKMIIKAPLPPQAGQARLEFNIVLRQTSSMILVVYGIGIFAAVAKSVTTERRRDTWLGLIATPLTGREILGSKMLGAILHGRETAYLLLGLWALGLASGAVHPLGFLAALTSLVVTGGLAAAFGLTNFSGDQSLERDARIPGPVQVLVGVGASLVVTMLPPLLVYVALLSFEDVQALVRGGAFPQIKFLNDVAKSRGILAAWLFTTTALAVLAILWTRAAFRGFDAAVGRPTRPESPEPPVRRAVGVLSTVPEA